MPWMERVIPFLEVSMPGRVQGPDLSPRLLLQKFAAPRGPIPAPKNAEGGVETSRQASLSLLNNTFRQLNASRQEGLGGRIDLLG